jgi:hypothetical protein
MLASEPVCGPWRITEDKHVTERAIEHCITRKRYTTNCQNLYHELRYLSKFIGCSQDSSYHQHRVQISPGTTTRSDTWRGLKREHTHTDELLRLILRTGMCGALRPVHTRNKWLTSSVSRRTVSCKRSQFVTGAREMSLQREAVLYIYIYYALNKRKKQQRWWQTQLYTNREV